MGRGGPTPPVATLVRQPTVGLSRCCGVVPPHTPQQRHKRAHGDRTFVTIPRAFHGRRIHDLFHVLVFHASLYFGFGLAVIHTVTFTLRYPKTRTLTAPFFVTLVRQ